MIHAPTWLRSIGRRGWRLKGIDLLVERCSEQLRHFIIKTKPSNNCCFASESAIGTCPGPACGQAHNVLAAPVTARGNAVNYKLPSISQVNDERVVRTLNSHNGPSSRKETAQSAYDLSGQKWSRAVNWAAVLTWLLILTMAAIVIATLMSEVWS